MNEQDFDRLRRAMVSNQLRTNAVSDAAVLTAMETTPREAFVGADQAGVSYRDTTVPLGEGRALNPPIATGRLLNAAQPRAGERALVIGSATGYVAALLTTLGCLVTALEESPDLAARAEAAGVVTVQGALILGWVADAPYDLIYIDGAVPSFPKAIVSQLIDGGRIVGALLDRGVSRLAIGHGGEGSFGVRTFADVETAPLPGFAPEPAFAF
jgi:protein-L-isoaspartate(D-aspartate) O-methyltransferase